MRLSWRDVAGEAGPRVAVRFLQPEIGNPRLLELQRSGKLKLEEQRTRTYSLDGVNEGYDDMRNGCSLRGVISFG